MPFRGSQASEPKWLWNWMDGKYACRVEELRIAGSAFSGKDIAKLTNFTHLHRVQIDRGRELADTDLALLADIPTLRALSLVNTRVRHTKSGTLRRLKLSALHILAGSNSAYGARWINDLEELKHLELVAPVTLADLDALAMVPKLETLKRR